ncbi:MAG: hypothetical protein CME62_11765 [Halobacteriovoraceae bacterium]|nr:hypothetical protein [Halobacteriovoraceae bacterium]|tara:strand:- start:1508 stop:2836 length:1329 start_codon:yes stop_codon:yes gene_type:complete
MTDIRKAVSLVIVQGKDIFTIIRHNHLRAFPGYTAFPGGKVDAEDQAETLDQTLLNTLYREAKEELGIDVIELQKSGQIEAIDKIAIATSPNYNPRRYEAHFYRIILKKKIDFILDSNEAKLGQWLDAGSLLREYNFGKRLLIYPIRKVIEELSNNTKFSQVIDFDLREVGKIPFIEPLRGVIQYMPLSNTLPPASRTNAFIIGGQEKILIDPSPKNVDEYRSLLEELKKFQLKGLMLSHHHKDHHEMAPEIAEYFNLPIYLSPDCHKRCLQKYGQDYFQKSQIEYLKEGDVVTSWLGEDVGVIEIPGHDEGQLGLIPESKKWCFVGDLFQGIGTVVVGGEEGDMQKYMHSLEKVISLGPHCVIPSHGIALGGTYILEKTLEHRKYRENQIKDLMNQGKSVDDMLGIIYFDLSRKLLPYARENILKHIEKIENEASAPKTES